MEKENKRIVDILGYDGLKIVQRSDMLSFSSDATMLASFVTINKSDKKIMDLGCGNAYIPIFLSLRTKAHIYGVEIQKEVYELACESILYNKLEKQITIINDDMKNVHKTLGTSSFDVVVSNPPYFKYKEESNVNKSSFQTIARHEVLITLDEVIQTAKILLKDGGTFAMVHRTDRLFEILDSFKKHSIEPKRIRFIYSSVTSSEAIAILIEGKKTKNKGGLKILPPLYYKNELDQYTDEVLKIFNYKKERYNVN